MHFKAKFFKILFIFPFFRKRYFGFYKKLFKPRKLFQGQSTVCRFDSSLKINVDMDEWIQQHIYFFGSWDERGTNFLKLNLNPGDVFFDVGANIGCFSLIASKIVGTEGKVHSFEPVTRVYEKLLANIQLNGLKNITAKRKAVFESSGTLELFVSSNENVGMSSIFHHDTESGQVEIAESISLDEYVQKEGITEIKMIKIDIEGAEIFALRGMKQILKELKPVLIIEISKDVFQNTKMEGNEVLEFMQSMRYEIRKIYKCGHTGPVSETKSEYTNYAFFPID